ncbi:MAG: TRAP transporter small permease [Pseudomonadota bacterium]
MSNSVELETSEDEARPSDPIGRVLTLMAKVLALFGGLVLLVIVGINFLSILGRSLFSAPLLGDFELVELGCAVAVSSFLPWCQLKRGNVIVDFVTSGLSDRWRQVLDSFSAIVFGLVAAFFTWRMFYGAQDMYTYNEETMLLQFPVWIPFIPVVFSFLLLSLCSFYTAYVSASQAAAADA